MVVLYNVLVWDAFMADSLVLETGASSNNDLLAWLAGLETRDCPGASTGDVVGETAALTSPPALPPIVMNIPGHETLSTWSVSLVLFRNDHSYQSTSLLFIWD